ncbi:MAG: TIGR03086 family metal-binding protein [Actinomycetota bacterium]
MIEAFQAAQDRLAELIANVKPSQYEDKTPCHEFTVKSLLNHIIGGQFLFSEVAKGNTVDVSGPTPDFAGNDPLGAFKTASQAALAAWSDPALSTRTLHFPFGDLNAMQGFGISLMEMNVHGWDLAKATGQDATIPEPAATMMLAGMKQGFNDGARGPIGSGAPFGPEVTVPESASNTDKIVAFLGRKP